MDFFAREDGTVIKKTYSNRAFVEEGSVLLTYKNAAGDEIKVVASGEGIVVYEKGIMNNKPFDEGTLLAKMSPCLHEVVMKDMCADCGKDLREKHGRAGQRVEVAAANVSMIHHVPELHVSNSLAQEIGIKDQERLLAARKLVLLIDLDQTLIHTTNRPFNIDPEKASDDIFKYTISNVEYTTKLRPYTREFLDSMSKLYELHIVTYGQRLYAHTIAQKIQEKKDGGKISYFDQRVLSRDELFSAQHKTNNLKALFPCGEQLIAIIDDRADVWQYSESLVQVKPYRFFREVGDINAPGTRAEVPPSVEIEENAEDDNILRTIEDVLTQAHKSFFNHYDKTSEIRDLKVVISYLRQQVLRGLVIVLSGVVPLGVDLERCDAYRICRQFGAKIEKAVNSKTTHVIAARYGTDKMHQANKLGIPVVTPQWLYACIEKWHKVEEKEFEVTVDSAPPKGGRPQGGQLIPEIHCIDAMKKETILDMEHEVDEALSDEDEENAADEENEQEAEDEEVKNADGDKSNRGKRPREAMDDDEDDEDVEEKKQCLRDYAQDDDDDEGENADYAGREDGYENVEYAGREEDDETTMDGPPTLDDEEEEEYDSMAALIERQISHEDEE